MDIDWVQFVNAVGFPIVAYVMMFYMCNTTIKENTAAIINLTNQMKINSEEKSHA